MSLTPELVHALIVDQHPQFSRLPVAYFGEGWDNQTFRLGDHLAVRLPRRSDAVALLVNEHRWLPVLAPRLPCPTPAPVAVGEPGHGFPWVWSIVPWIDGEPADLALLAGDQGLELARFLRALHQPAAPDAPVNRLRGMRIDWRREAVEAMLGRLRQTSDLIAPAIERAWEEALAAPTSITPMWVHGDMHAQNFLVREGRLAGVIDWGDMSGSDPAVDLASVWSVLATPKARAAALEAYAPDAATLARAKGWAVIFGVVLFENGRINDPRHALNGEATLRRLAEPAG